MNLYILLNFNNYYNRRVKGQEYTNIYDIISDYDYEVYQNINFNPNDSVNTTQILNTNAEGDYLIACEEDGTIVSRWFIIEATRLRNGQYEYTLHRDAIVDYYNDVIDSPVFIEKATVSAGDSAIFNNENMTFNQIKSAETLLKDATQTPWIVGYIARNYAGATITATPDITVDQSVANISDYDFYTYVNNDFKGYSDNITYAVEVGGGSRKYDYYFNNEGASNNYFRRASGDTEIGPVGVVSGVLLVSGSLHGTNQDQLNARAATLNDLINNTKSSSVFSYINATESISTKNGLQEFLAQNGAIIHATNTNTYYKVRIEKKNDTTITKTSITVGTNLFNDWIAAALRSANITRNSQDQSKTFGYQIKAPTYRIVLEVISASELHVTIPTSTARNHLTDAPYDMFAIPYGAINIKRGNIINENNAAAALFMATEIQRTLGSQCYDIQLLPYCPFEAQLPIETTLMTTKDASEIYYQAAGSSVQQFRSIMFWCTQSTREFNIAHSIVVNDVKIENECDKYRLVSPNYNGTFEFSAAKNGGVDYFNVDLTYKPYQSYIHINPNFGRLYGSDYNDARGLICGGDFSLPQISDAWQQYQIQNKNYENIFNRQIGSMELNNKVQMAQDISNAISGTLTGVATGALMGKGPVGAAIGGVTSLGGGIADIITNETLRNDAMDQTKDLFGYNLGNIQALPYSLTKIGALNNNNKLYPFVEYYTCTDEEKEALRQKLKYNGMTLMRIDKIANYIQAEPSYIKGQLIRCESISNDYYLLNTIAQELNKGVYI